ncbi:MAG: hypothetical protein JWQ21_3146 [Herminiimonas sp.]|nr:hypothetical protein [Herminiimonas sp.]
MNTTVTAATDDEVIPATKVWLERAVIGLNLCPFAKAVHVKNQIRYVLSRAIDPKALCAELIDELRFLHAADPAVLDTTLLIHPHVLTNFLDYNDFLDVADTAVADLGFIGDIQIASFHPHYQFAGTEADDIDNYTNRSPYPMLHLLRETSIEFAVTAFPDASQIFERNIETLRRIGHDGWHELSIATPSEYAVKQIADVQKK